MREEEKKKKEEDRLKKEEEKRKRDEAREAERREKEAEKEKKDEEKRIEEEKKKQKEEAEVKMLLNYFSCVIMIKYFTGMRIERNWLANRLQKGIFYLLYLFKSFISIFFLFLEKEERKSC